MKLSPWTVLNGRGFQHEILDDDGQRIASVVGGPGSADVARLMAAAPYLLAACEEMLVAEVDEVSGVREMMRAAVMRARSDTQRFPPGDALLRQVVR